MMKSPTPILLLLSFVVSGCFVTETGNPPARPEVDDGLLNLRPHAGTGIDIAKIEGDAGAISPAEGTVHLINLDRREVAVQTAVQADGSFSEVEIPLRADEEIRLFVENPEGERSLPVDLGLSGGLLSVIDRLHSDCLLAPTETNSEQLVVENRCAFQIEFEPPLLRDGMAGVSLESTATFALRSGEQATISLRCDGECDDVLLLPFTSEAGSGRRAAMVRRE